MAPTTAPAIPKGRILPQKESALFKSLLSMYETRQFKKGLKVADQILKKFPEHGETTSMKGLILTNMNKKEEGLDLVKKGVRLDLSSHICWHVYGIIHKADRNYEEALRCYLQALRFDKDNQNILRDAAQLQVQLRNYEGFQETRMTLLKLRPTIRLNWIGLAVAYHLNGRPEDAKHVLESYIKTLKNIPNYDVEYSELLLYYIRVLEDLGQYSDALEQLDIHAKSRAIVDKTAIMHSRARILSKSGQAPESEEAWEALIAENSENYDWYHGYLANRQVDLDNLTEETLKQALEALAGFEEQYPKATAPKRLALKLSSGDEFKSRVEAYLLSGLRGGIPSLYADLKSLYSDPAKEAVIREIVEGLCQSVEPASENLRSSPESIDEVEPPTTWLWTLYYLAQHYSHISRASPEKTLEYLEKAIQHSPTLPELYMAKARTLKRAGDLIGALASMEEARKLDLQDRFLNTKSAKYMLREGRVDDAQVTLGLFTKKDAPNPGADLEDMQSLLYLVEEADSFYAQEKLPRALKRYKSVEKTFHEFEDDQFDFHSYCVRRHTLNAYHSLLRFEDKLRSHPAYQAAALGAARIYVRLHDDPSLVAANTPTAPSEDAKKAKKKAKKATSKSPPLAASTATADTSKDDGVPLPPVDDDPDGLKALSVSDPLEQAVKLLKPLEQLGGDKIDVWLIIYDVAVRRKKYLQALRALDLARKLQPDHPELHFRYVDFKHTLTSVDMTTIPHVQTLTNTFFSTVFPSNDISLEQYNSDYLQAHPNAPDAILGYARALHRVRGESGKEAVEESVFQIAKPEMAPGITVARESVNFLRLTVKSSASRLSDFQASLCAKYPFSTIFKPEEEKQKLREAFAKNSSNDESKEEVNP